MIAIAAKLAAKPPTIVYPTGVFPTDVQNVQAAIDQGGTVLLKATDSVGHPLAFNFGAPTADPPAREVSVETSVSLVGEQVGNSRTTINGGNNPIRIFGGMNSIEGIKFNGPRNAAIHIRATTGTRVIGNEIDGVVPRPIFGFTLTDGIEVGALNPADISGNVVISGNTFGDLTGDFSIAINVDTVAANVTISNNTFQLGQSPTDLGFVNSAAIAAIRCHAPVNIFGNTIAIGPGVVFSGIVIIGGPDARYHVFSNTLNTQGPFTDGIDTIGVTGDPGVTVSAVIENNSINLLNTDIAQGSGIGLIGAVTKSTIQGNVITGSGPTAMFGGGSFLGDPTLKVSNNRFLFNDISQLIPSVASIFFDQQTVNNTVRGQCVAVIDLGTGNDISCPNSHSNVNSGAFTTRQQMIQRALQAQSAVRAQSNDVNPQ